MRAPRAFCSALPWLVAGSIGGAAAAAAAAVPDAPPEAVVGTLGSNEPNRVGLDLAPAGSESFRMLLDTGAQIRVLLSGKAAPCLGIDAASLPRVDWARRRSGEGPARRRLAAAETGLALRLVLCASSSGGLAT